MDILVTLLGIALAAGGLVYGFLNGFFRRVGNCKNPCWAEGLIVRVYEAGVDSRGKCLYYADIEYRSDGTRIRGPFGEEQEFLGHRYVIQTAYTSSDFYVGKKVHITYDRRYPHQGVLMADVKVYFLTIGMVFCGMILFLIGG